MVKGSEGEDFGVPVVDSHAIGCGEFGGGKAFHAGSVGSEIQMTVWRGSSWIGLHLTYARATHRVKVVPGT